MNKIADDEKIKEPERDIPVIDRADIIILGGGPAGVAAATVASRHGAEVLLIERYGCLGGLATGGLVIMLWSYGPSGKLLVKGLPFEILERLGKYDAVRRSSWKPQTRGEEPIFDPEIYKYICFEMLGESGTRLLLHTWAVGAKISNESIDAVIIESKSGRQAIKGKIFIDTSGDADLAEWCNIPYLKGYSPIGLDVLFGGIDGKKLRKFYTRYPEDYKKLKSKIDPHGEFDPPQVAWRDDVAFCMAGGIGVSHDGSDDISANNVNTFSLNGRQDALNAYDLTGVEAYMRKRIMEVWRFFKCNVPGFKNSFILSTASQIGTRESRRIIGKYTITEDDVLGGHFDNSVGKAANWLHPQRILFDIPYTSLVSPQINNLLFAGRCISASHKAHNTTRVLIPSIITGQAAGTAAALCLKEKTEVQSLDIKNLQHILKEDGVIL